MKELIEEYQGKLERIRAKIQPCIIRGLPCREWMIEAALYLEFITELKRIGNEGEVRK